MEFESKVMIPSVDDIDEVAIPTRGRKVLRIVIEIEVGGTKNHSGRLKEAYISAVASAGEAVREVMMSGSVLGLTSHMSYGYRHMEGADVEWTVVDGNDE